MTTTTTTADVTTETRTVAFVGPSHRRIDVGDTLGTIRLVRKLGEGGHGRVFQGKCAATGVMRAVKLLERREYLARFTWEYRLLDRVRSPNVVHVHSFHLQPTPYFVMDYVPGQTLERFRRDQGGTVLPAEVLRIARQICIGLERLHNIGIIHRDLNPKNVLRGPDGHITLIDLGIAKALPEFTFDSDVVVTTCALGTPGFVAPEQRNRHLPDCKTDFYGLGALMYFLLTGRKFRPEVGVEIRQTALRIFLEQLLATDPQARFLSMADLKSELDVLGEHFDHDTSPAKTVVVIHRSNNVTLLASMVMVLLALTVWMFRSSEPSPTPPATNTAMHLVATPTADRPETSMQVQDFQPPPQEQVAPPARVTEDKPEPAATVNEPAASQTTNDENRASKQEKRRARKAAKRAFEKDLRRALQTCAVPPQTLHYVVTPTDLQLTGPEISKRQKCIEKFRKPAKGRFSGMIEYRGAGT